MEQRDKEVLIEKLIKRSLEEPEFLKKAVDVCPELLTALSQAMEETKTEEYDNYLKNKVL